MKKRISIFKDRRAESYVDVGVTVLIVCFLLVFICSFVSLLSAQDRVDRICKGLCEMASVRGTTDLGDSLEALVGDSSMPVTVDFSNTVYWDEESRVQLGDAIVCTVRAEIVFIGFGNYVRTIEVSATSTGVSRVYWK
ncbi:MAG: DUF4320 family protein [Clostridia bacterium]|nr:DUF4320 family protein [Clostridia bacterium]